jgi:hypothetical protein
MNLSDFGLDPHDCTTVSVGDTFGRLTVRAIGKKPGTYRYMAVCVCECGSAPSAVRMDGLISGAVLSCGCYRLDRIKTHGLSKHPLYDVWHSMLRRCTNPRDVSYKNYGGRGITVCERWHAIENFIADMEPTYIPGLEIDRQDNDKGYDARNCRWVSPSVNCDNRRSGVYLTHAGKTQSLRQWAKETGLNYGTLHERLNVWGWSVEKALTTPALSKDERMKIARTIRWGEKPSP